MKSCILAAFLFGVVLGMDDYCPDGSEFFVADANPDGTCPDALPAPKTSITRPCQEVCYICHTKFLYRVTEHLADLCFVDVRVGSSAYLFGFSSSPQTTIERNISQMCQQKVLGHLAQLMLIFRRDRY